MAKPVLRALGLQTAANEAALADGALVKATNVVIRGSGVIEPRRGYERLSYQPTVTTGKDLYFYGSTAIYHYDSKLAYDTGAAWTEYSGTYVAPDPSNLRMKHMEVAGNFYFTTSAGVYRLSSTTGTPALAGAPYAPGLDLDERVYTAAAGDLERTGGDTVTVTTSAAHGFYAGQSVQMTSAGEADFANGTKTVATVPDQFTFTYTEAGSNTTSGSDQTFMVAVLVDTGVVLADGYQAAYRIVFDDPDANTKRKLGGTSGRMVIANASGMTGYTASTARNVWVRVLLPDDVTTNCYLQLYRSESVPTDTDPGEDLGLVYEVKIKPTDVTRGYVDIKDIVPDALIGPSIYTSPNLGASPVDNNHRPPLAKDLVHWRDRAFYVNTQDVQRFVVNLIAVGASGLQDGDKVIIGAETYSAKTTPVFAEDFKVSSSASPGIQIQDTAISLVSAINRVSSSYHAEYASSSDETPGRIAIFARSVSTAAFSIYAYDSAASNTTARTAFAPVLGGTAPYVDTADLSRTGSTVTADFNSNHSFQVGDRVSVSTGDANFGTGPHTITAVTSTTILWSEAGSATTLNGQTVTQYDPPTSTADTFANRIHYSKPQEYEACPLLNYFDVGARNKRIWRAVRLVDRMLVFKEDGVFQVTGDAPFRVDELDGTIPLASGAADSVVVVDNAACAITTKGAVAITEAGAQLIGGPVYDLQTQSTWGNTACGYESENLYIVRGVNAQGSSGVFAYNTKLNTWVFWDLLPVAMRVQPSTDKLWMVFNSDGSVNRERKDFTESDYRDRSIAVTLTAYNTTTGAFTITGATANTGDVIEASGIAGLVSSTNTGVFVTTQGDMTTKVGQAMTLSRSYQCDVQYAARTADAPANEKHAADCVWHFRKYKFYEPLSTFASDKDSTEETVAIKRADRSITHVATWSSTYLRVVPVNKRVGVPKDMSRHAYLWVGFRCKEAFAYWALNGHTITSGTDDVKGAR